MPEEMIVVRGTEFPLPFSPDVIVIDRDSVVERKHVRSHNEWHNGVGKNIGRGGAAMSHSEALSRSSVGE